MKLVQHLLPEARWDEGRCFWQLSQNLLVLGLHGSAPKDPVDKGAQEPPGETPRLPEHGGLIPARKADLERRQDRWDPAGSRDGFYLKRLEGRCDKDVGSPLFHLPDLAFEKPWESSLCLGLDQLAHLVDVTFLERFADLRCVKELLNVQPSACNLNAELAHKLHVVGVRGDADHETRLLHRQAQRRERLDVAARTVGEDHDAAPLRRDRPSSLRRVRRLRLRSVHC
mmetsp:Transcript_41628/g.108381  ORF Transcript_41628/g.108381 Transcript_41628/m.108381 type:complete len:227 (-) Transcript_41628:73-753(-)